MKKNISLLVVLALNVFFVSYCDFTAENGQSLNNSESAIQKSAFQKASVLKKRKITTSRGEFTIREGGNENGVPVVMIHGWPESSYCWEGVAAHLDPSLRIIAPDLRGLGDSDRTLDTQLYQKDELATDIIEILSVLDIDTFYLVGHDWGGIVSQLIAYGIPERVNKLIIMNIPVLNNVEGLTTASEIIQKQGSRSSWYQYFQQQPDLPEAMIKGNEDVWVSHFFKDRPVPEESIAEYIRCYKIKDTPATAASYYRVMAADAETFVKFYTHRFTMPTLYIYGNLDSVIIPEYLTGIENVFDTIEVKEIEAAHFVQEEKPQEVAQLMNDFFHASQEQ